MTRLRSNILANFGGQACAVVMGIAFVPIYIRILGIEVYGLIGFFISVQAFLTVLDMGLSATVNRELARHRHIGSDANVQRDLVRTLEWMYWPTGILIAFGVYSLGTPIAEHWLKPVELGVERTAHAIALMGLSTALQWPCGFYAGGFRGLERQVVLNGLSAAFATLRYGGAALILLYHSPTLESFLWWQIGVSTLQTTVLGLYLWRLLPKSTQTPTFQLEHLREVHGFALRLATIAAVSFLVTQADRLLLSTLLPLTEFGYYTLAATVAGALSAVIQPFFAALYPRYSGLVAVGDEEKLILLYHQSNQLLVVIVAATASVVAFFSEDLLRQWTHDPVVAAKSSLILSILVTGTALNGLMHLPYALQLAYGWTRLALIQNLLALLVIPPAVWWLGTHFGGAGVATVWVALSLGNLAISIPLMHKRLMPSETARWYLQDVLPPTITAITIAGAIRMTAPVLDGLAGAFTIGLIGLATLCCTGLASPVARERARQSVFWFLQ